MDLNQFKWTREPASYSVTSDKIEIITKRPITASEQELLVNSRAKSAKLRI